MNRRVPIGPAAIDVMLALYEMEPATVSLIETALGRGPKAVPAVFTELRKQNLVRRRKADRGPGPSEDEKLGFVPMRTRPGKRPFLYTLTSKGRRVAHGLNLASQAFRERDATPAIQEEHYASA